MASYLLVCLSAVLLSQVEAEPGELVSITRIGQQDAHAQTLDIAFTAQGQHITLSLHRNDHISSDVPVMIGHSNVLSHWKTKSRERIIAYKDKKSHAAISVRYSQDSNKKPKLHYRGNFLLGTKLLAIEPSTSGPHHYVYDVPTETVIYDTEGVLRPSIAEMTEFSRDWWEFQNRTTPAPTSPVPHCVETIIIPDYRIYKRWYDNSEASTPQEKHDDAINNLRFVFSHLYNGMDLRYESIEEPEFTVYVRVTGFYIPTTPEDAPWTEKNTVPGNHDRDWVHAYDTLDDLEVWVNDPEIVPKLPQHDVVSLFTAFIMFGGYNSDGRKRRIQGLADIKGVCTYYRVNVNQYQDEYPTIQTGAHEMGHNLGAYHDGSGNTCTGRDQYIMASSPGVLHEDNYLNPYKFSVCSRHDFRLHFNFMTQSGTNCLLNPGDNIHDDVIQENLKKAPGQVYTVDEQCQAVHGKVSFYCGGGNHDKDICMSMHCWVPEYQRCYASVENRAATGTTCGNKKWCYRTECLEDDRAPPAKDYCIYGDYLDKYPDGRTCKQVIKEQTYYCYPDSIYKYRDDCCQSCMDAKKDVPGCEFGDRENHCDSIQARDCYGESLRHRCCETCPKHSINITGCEYGDKASWCATMAPSGCYVSNNTCCKRCHELETDDPDCLWGDAASWCPTIARKDCYRDHKTCCGFCKQYETGVEGCEYGDRNNYCTKDMCSDPSWWNDCCLTCLEESGKTTTPSSISTTYNPPPGCKDHASWCATMPMRDCYVSAHTCCATCAKYDNGKESCMYGDKVGWCDKFDNEKDCQRPDIKEPCCQTCEKYSRMPNLYKFRR